ncbi:MAG: NADH-quinone oxidoreductase subunit NuoE [Spirochaetales bacterium]|nr:NADH-quinone oxidoreductase subunit NuoE [Spirochaetales bacterium]
MITTRESLNSILNKYPKNPEYLLPVLQDIQLEFHYLSEESLKSVSEKLGLPLTRVYSVATFYNAFSLQPKGKNIIQVCLGTACHIKGSPRLLDELVLVLGIKEGETTENGLFSVEAVRCLGCCSLAPAMMINGKTYGNVKPENITTILEEYKTKNHED